MTDTLYPKGKEGFLSSIQMDSDTIKVALIDTDVITYDAAHDNYDDISAGVIGTPVALGSKTITGGVFDSADPTWTSVTGDDAEAIVMYKDTGTPSTSRLIGWWDEPGGFPLTVNGGNVTYAVHASGWFAL